MTTFNLTKKRSAALDAAVGALVKRDEAAVTFTATLQELRKAGFKPAHLDSAGKGAANPAGPAYAAAMEAAATRLFSKADMAVWNGPNGKARSALSRRASNAVRALRTALGKDVPTSAGKAASKASPIDVVLNALTRVRAPLVKSVSADKPTTAQAERIAAFGGVAEIKATIAAIDAAIATVPKK